MVTSWSTHPGSSDIHLYVALVNSHFSFAAIITECVNVVQITCMCVQCVGMHCELARVVRTSHMVMSHMCTCVGESMSRLYTYMYMPIYGVGTWPCDIRYAM